MDYHHYLEITFQLHMVEHSMVQNDVLVFGIEAIKARYVTPVDLAIVGLLAAWTWAFGSLVAITQMGIGSQLANLMELQGSHTRNKFLFAVRAIGDDITQETQVMRRDHTTELVEIDIHPRRLRISGLSAGRCLLDTETVCTIIGDVEPGQGRDFQSFFCTAVAAVPKAINAIGMLATFGHKTGVHDQGLSMLRRDGFGDGGLVERDPVKVSGVPS